LYADLHSFAYVPKNDIAGSYGYFMYRFFEELPYVFP
jgi:hypothetical protein